MGEHDPWKSTAIALLLLFAMAVVTALMMANWVGNDQATVRRTVSGRGARLAVIPTAADIDACNAQAKTQVTSATTEVPKYGVTGGAASASAGTLYGLNETNKNDVRYQQAYRHCMRGRGYVG